MSKNKEVQEGLSFLNRAAGQVAAVRRALEQSMDAPGGEEWEDQISELPQPEEPAAPEPPKTGLALERDTRTREQFERNWFQRLRHKRKLK